MSTWTGFYIDREKDSMISKFKITKAKIVRQVTSGQAATMDFRTERITVTIDPTTQAITQANCG
ncbi:hypothetical protein [Acinetobacter zhairhuonensis]|jgi:hypothetical protein|uniref:hypothetical protein n=1 Tax=Acinetobacter sp. A7.4 TaxID=2919921 RepID=UPI001F4FB606|nr:hypothetical protein [Acinetobacter sp. A7.4]MCJ8162906.1 hypothetical protein [Acinetobacter sp. A7.4]